MYQKKKGLAVNSEDLVKMYLIETKIVIKFSLAGITKKRGMKNLGLNFFKLLKTHVEKISIFRLSRMLMKPKKLKHPFQDVGERIGS
jgi:hypothetical protein